MVEQSALVEFVHRTFPAAKVALFIAHPAPEFNFMQRFTSIILVALCAVAALDARAETSACGAVGAETVQVVAVDERLELVLEDGRRILLVGIEPPPKNILQVSPARERLAEWLLAQEIRLRLLANQPDRWGRVPALAFAPVEGAGAVSVQETLLREGLVRLRLVPPPPCLKDLRLAEATARDSGDGVWAQEATATLEAGERADFDGRDGTSVVVEGKVFAVKQSGYRTYVNFGPHRYGDFSVIILKPNLKIFDKAGLSVPSLLGRKLRVRGLLDMRFGPQIEVANPDAIEIID